MIARDADYNDRCSRDVLCALDLCKTAERIEVLSKVVTLRGPKHTVLGGVPITHGNGKGRGFESAIAN